MSLNTWAQIDEHFGTWFSARGSYVLSDRLSLGGYGEIRQYEVGHNLNFFYLQGTLNYKLNPKFTLTGGYLWGIIDTTFEPPNTNNVIENRLLEQLSYKHSLGKLGFNHRFRFEQRFWNDQNGKEIRHRVRYQIKLRYPLTDTFYLTGYEELILRDEKKVFEQNILTGAIGVKCSKHFGFEIGYVKHHFLDINMDRLQVCLVFQ